MPRATPELRRWLASLALLAPAAMPYVSHVLEWKSYSLPTGYIQPDMPIYMAKAREAFDGGNFAIFYGNPCGGSEYEPRVYFQPWTFALGLVHWLSGLRPGTLFVAFWFVAAWAAVRAAVALYEDYVGLDSRSRRIGLVAFLWGGGLLVASGTVGAWLGHGFIRWDDLLALDPFKGWWFLNLGRNFVYPTEALYHAIAFASLLNAARGRIGLTLVFAAVTASCSPFAGLELLAILWLWGIVEIVASSNRGRPFRFFLGVNGLCAAFLGYYAYFLNDFPEHRELASQMALGWRYSAATMMAAYGPVFVLAAWTTGSSWRSIFGDPRQRLLLAWAVAAIALENHDCLVSPRQPLHFTRGYAWSALFLLGAPRLVGWFDRLSRLRKPWGVLFRIALLSAIVLDNAVWFAGFIREIRVPGRNGIRLSSEELAVLRRLDQDDLLGHVVVSEDERLSYLVVAETRLRSWVGHGLETPGYPRCRREVEALFARGEFATAWEGRAVAILRYRRAGEATLPDWLKDRGVSRAVFENRKFQIFQIREKGQRPSRYAHERSGTRVTFSTESRSTTLDECRIIGRAILARVRGTFPDHHRRILVRLDE